MSIEIQVTPLLPDRDWVGIFKEIANKVREAGDVARKHDCEGTAAWLYNLAL